MHYLLSFAVFRKLAAALSAVVGITLTPFTFLVWLVEFAKSRLDTALEVARNNYEERP